MPNDDPPQKKTKYALESNYYKTFSLMVLDDNHSISELLSITRKCTKNQILDFCNKGEKIKSAIEIACQKDHYHELIIEIL